MDTDKITQDEMVKMFGDAMPIEAVNLIWQSPGTKTVGEVRAELRRIAEKRPFVSGSCEGERCQCGQPAQHKVEETIFHDDPVPHRHPLTSYICHHHFVEIMGPAADRRS
jgi:hypothetical protein